MKRAWWVVLLWSLASGADATTTRAGLTYNRLQGLQQQVLEQAVKNTHLPTTAEGLNGLKRVDGQPISESRMLDAWGQPFVYRAPSRSSDRLFDVYSIGPNGRDDGGEEDDIVPWDYRGYYSPGHNFLENAFMYVALLDGPVLFVGILSWFVYRQLRARKRLES